MASFLSKLRKPHEPPQAQPIAGQETPNAVQAGSAPATALPESGKRHPPASHLKKNLAGIFSNIKHRTAPPSPQPPQWLSSVDLSRVRFPANVVVPRSEDVTTWITQLHQRSGVVKKRHSVGSGLHFHKPSSPRYQFAKHQMNANERTQLSAILRHLIEQQTLDPQAQNEITDLYLSLQYARLRTHTPHERAVVRDAHIGVGILGGAAILLGPLVVVTSYVAIRSSMNTRRLYYRSTARPEYDEAFADMRGLLRSPHVDEKIKLRVAGEILDRYIRSEKLLSTRHADPILYALNGGIVPPGLAMERGPDGERRRPVGMTSRILRDPSTDEQKRQLIAWALDPLMYSATNQDVMLNLTLQRIYKKINRVFEQEGRAPLTPPADLAAWNEKRNAPAFNSLLRRAEEDANNFPSRTAVVYHNVAAILDAITTDPSFAEQVFHDSVGGTKYCINNVLEYISELAVRSTHRTLVRQIESGAMDIEEFKKTSLRALRLETLEQYIAKAIVPHAINHNPRVADFYEPEISQSIKSDLIKRLDLPRSVNHSTAEYLGKSDNHKTYLKNARSHVATFAGNLENQRAFLLTDPLWREGVIALARRQGKQHDIETLKRYTLRQADDTWDEGTHMDASGMPVQDMDLERAILGWTGLTQLYRPRTGQKILDADGQGKDKYKTETAAFQDLYDRIEAMEKQFRTAIQDIERQFVSHATDSILRNDAVLPEDGNFSPHFKLPETWELEMKALATMSRAAELVELSDVFQKKEKDIERLNQEIDHFVKSGTFNDLAGAVSSLDEEQRAGVVESMRNFHSKAPYVSQVFNLRAYLDRLAAKVPGINLQEDQPLPEDLVRLRTKLIELQQAKNARSLIYPNLENADISVLEQTEAIQKDDLNALLQNLRDPNVSQDFSPLDREQVDSLIKELEKFYADPNNSNERFDLDQHIARILETASEAAQQSRPESLNSKSESSVTPAAATPKREGNTPAALLALRDRFWAIAQTRHEHALTSQRLEDVKAHPGTTPFSRSSSIPSIAFDPRATAAIPLLNQEFISPPLEAVSPEEAAVLAEHALNQKAFSTDFDIETNAPTQAYVEAMAMNARQARITLERAGLETGEASGAGNNCLIHSILDGMGITGEENLKMANDLRQALITRLDAHGESLGAFEYLNTFGSHPATLIDLINERFPDADVGLRIYTPLPGGGLFFNNPESEGGTTNQARRNTIAVMWVGNHFEPIKMTVGEASHPH